jgi:hypothetical protein|tara:strand:- start:472 stop:627 length:156 start_codon:yes stop_codon:yes gene_type:complete
LFNIQDLAFTADEDISEELNLLEVKLGRESKSSQVRLDTVSKAFKRFGSFS